MASFSFPLNAKGGIDSKLVAALSGRHLEVVPTPEHNHPFLAVCHCWLQFTKDLDAFLKTLATCERNWSPECAVLSPAFREVVYRAAELFEAYIKTLPKTMPLAMVKPHKLAFNGFTEAAKRHKKKWGTICNSLKHTNNLLLTAGSVENALAVPFYGFTLLAPEDTNTAVRNKDVHPNDEVHHSYAVAINELLVDLLKTDQLAAQVIAALPEGSEPAVLQHTQQILAEATLESVLTRPHIRFPDQPRLFNGLQKRRDHIISMRLLAVSPEAVTVSLELQVGPLTRSYQLMPKGLTA